MHQQASPKANNKQSTLSTQPTKQATYNQPTTNINNQTQTIKKQPKHHHVSSNHPERSNAHHKRKQQHYYTTETMQPQNKQIIN